MKYLKEQKYSDDRTYKMLMTYNAPTQKMYGLPKTNEIHPVKFRPIIAGIEDRLIV